MIKPQPEQTLADTQETSHPVGTGLGETAGGLIGSTAPPGTPGPVKVGSDRGQFTGMNFDHHTQLPHIAAAIEHYTKVETLLRYRFRDRQYARGHRFEDFAQAYLHGVACHDRHGYQVWNPQIEADVRHGWETDPASQDMAWQQAREVIMDGWHAAEHVGESTHS